MNVLMGFLFAVIVLISLILITLILVQPSKSGGLGSAFGGAGESVFGAQAVGQLSKLTVVLISVFFVLTLALAVLSAHRAESGSGAADRIAAMAEAEAGSAAVPEAPAEAPVPEKE